MPKLADPRVKIPTVTMNFRQRPAVKAAALEGARAAGVSLTDFVAAAIAEKCGRPDLIPATLDQQVIDVSAGPTDGGSELRESA